VGKSLYSPKCAPQGHLEMKPRHLSEHIIVALDGAHFTWTKRDGIPDTCRRVALHTPPSDKPVIRAVAEHLELNE
jgi:hypothetical protein